ncbi:MAG TPA: VWA domain-containing protein [Pyrinomonadaceae bacterium]|nr:VWA domain-containing protein [Pyrinomonadaceae bacterium]
MKKHFPVWLLASSLLTSTLAQQTSTPTTPAPTTQPPPQQQQQQQQQQRDDEDAKTPGKDDVVSISVNLVQLDVNVTDDKGRQISDLRPEDFEVYEDGRLQKITNFSYVSYNASSGNPTVTTPPVNAAPLSTGKVPPPVPPVRLRPEQVRRTVALVVDDLGLSHESSTQVRHALRKFVDEQMQPGDLVAVIRTGAGMGALQQFTSDKRLLHAAIDRVRYNLSSRSSVSTFAPIGGGEITLARDPGDHLKTDRYTITSDEYRPGQQLDQFREELFSVGTLGALNFIVRGLKDLPGRKSVVLFSDGFKLYTEDPGNVRVVDSLRRLTDLARRASVVFYTIDPRGLQIFGMTAADDLSGPIGAFGGAPGLGDVTKVGEEKAAAQVRQMKSRVADPYAQHHADIEGSIADRRSEFFESQHGLSFLATQTGGFLVKNSNDVGHSLRRVLNDQSGYYLIGYRPDDSTFKAQNGRRGFHNITVKVRRPGAQARTRTGFYGYTDAEARQVRRTPTEQMFAALTSPFNAGDVRLRMSSMFGYDLEKGPFTQSLLHIDTRDLLFKLEPDGTRRAAIEIMAVTFDDNGKVIDQDDRPYQIRIAENEYQRALEAGLVYIVTLPIKKPGGYQLRIAVRDALTARIGSANQFVDIPNVKKGRLTLSGVTLRGVRATGAQNLKVGGAQAAAAASAATSLTAQEVQSTTNGRVDESDPHSGPAGRRLQRGMVLEYGYLIYNAQLDKATRRPQLETQVRLFRDGQLVYAGRANEFNASTQKELKRLVAGGSLQLGSDLTPGDYVLQVVVVDKLAKENQRVATQWIDFDIVK